MSHVFWRILATAPSRLSTATRTRRDSTGVVAWQRLLWAPHVRALPVCGFHADASRGIAVSVMGALAAVVAASFARPPAAAEVQSGERLVMSVDCGGTTSRLRLYSVDPEAAIVEGKEAPGTLVAEEKFPNILFKSLEEIISLFLKRNCDPGKSPTVAVLAVAGIVTSNQCRFTNLDWIVDGTKLAKSLGIRRVEIINDFVAQGYGTLTLGDDDLVKLNDVEPRRGAPIACIGAGTGLGECFLTSDPSGSYRCYPSEGGHAEFPPRGEGVDDEQIELLQYLKVKFSGFNRISVERVVSGTGISNVYQFLAYRNPKKVDKAMHREFLNQNEDASVIAKHAVPGSLCHDALRIFSECYGAQSGTLAIQVMPFRGLYITGGVSKKLSHLIADPSGAFMAAFKDKGRVSPLLEQVPLFLVKSDDMGQRGAHLRSVRLLQEALAGTPSRIEHMPLKSGLVPSNGMDPEGLDTGFGLGQVLQEYRDRNRRLNITADEAAEHEPVLQTMLWRVSRIGVASNPDDWICRDTWLARNGCLCHLRLTTRQNEVYYTKEDLASATIVELSEAESHKPWSFKIDVPGFTPGIFAAETSAGRDYWLEKLKEAQKQNRVGS